MIRFLLVTGRAGRHIVEESLFESLRCNVPAGYRGWDKAAAIKGMEDLGLKYRHSRIGRWSTEYFEATEEQAVLVKMFMQ